MFLWKEPGLKPATSGLQNITDHEATVDPIQIQHTDSYFVFLYYF